MIWYYVEASQQAGPVTDEELEELVRTGRIQQDTLVWREGMSQWQPYRMVKPAAGGGARLPEPPVTAVAGLSGDEVVCAECNQVFSKDNAIQYGTNWVCANCKPRFIQKVREGVGYAPAGPMEYAGFWMRFLAYFVDQIILGVATFGIAMVIGVAMRPETEGASMAVALIGNAISLIISASYEIWFIGKMGATPGKMALGLKVVDEHGGPIGFGRATGRFFGKILSGIVCMIGYIMAAFDEEKRALHDRLCNTRVVKG
jgi:uncharacterized RDD family membrane protein YckC